MYLGIGVNGKNLWRDRKVEGHLVDAQPRISSIRHSEVKFRFSVFVEVMILRSLGGRNLEKLFDPAGAGVRHRLKNPWPPYRRSSLPSIQHNDATQPNIEIFRRCERPETGAGAKRSPKKMEKKRNLPSRRPRFVQATPKHGNHHLMGPSSIVRRGNEIQKSEVRKILRFLVNIQ